MSVNISTARWQLRSDRIADQATLTDRRTQQHHTVKLSSCPSPFAMAQMKEADFDRTMEGLL